MRPFLIGLLWLTGFVAGGAALRAQDAPPAVDTSTTPGLTPTPADSQVVLHLRDGSRLLGQVLEVTHTTVRVRSALGESVVTRDAIVRVETWGRSGRRGEYWPPTPNRTRLFFAPTGRMLRRGEVYFGDAYLILPSIQVGVTNAVTLGGGMSIAPFGLDEQVYYLTPKLGLYRSATLNVAVGGVLAGSPRLKRESPFGIGYGVATFGSDDASVTVGTGLTYSAIGPGKPLLMIGGERRLSRRIALASENYVLLSELGSPVLSGGVRFLSDRLSVDLAGFFPPDQFLPIPYVAFIYVW